MTGNAGGADRFAQMREMIDALEHQENTMPDIGGEPTRFQLNTGSNRVDTVLSVVAECAVSLRAAAEEARRGLDTDTHSHLSMRQRDITYHLLEEVTDAAIAADKTMQDVLGLLGAGDAEEDEGEETA